MKKQPTIRLGVMLVVFLFGTYLNRCIAQIGQFPPPQDLVNATYYEGMRTHTDVSAATLKLKSFVARTNLDNSSSNFKVMWYTPANLSNVELDFFVEYKKKGTYYMQPVRKVWGEGYNEFIWDKNRLARTNGIEAGDLMGVLKSKRRNMLIPLMFYSGSQPAILGSYECIFVSDQTVNVRLTIYNSDEQELKSYALQNQGANSPIVIRFDSSNLGSGKHYLNVEYYSNSGGQTIHDNTTYTFYHVK